MASMVKCCNYGALNNGVMDIAAALFRGVVAASQTYPFVDWVQILPGAGSFSRIGRMMVETNVFASSQTTDQSFNLNRAGSIAVAFLDTPIPPIDPGFAVWPRRLGKALWTV
jgi:hypothetical protein